VSIFIFIKADITIHPSINNHTANELESSDEDIYEDITYNSFDDSDVSLNYFFKLITI
jgi:hypothetical protein